MPSALAKTNLIVTNTLHSFMMNILLAFAPAPQNGQADPTGQLLSTVMMFGAIILIFYFMMIRPQQKRQKEMKTMLDSLKKGDKIVTSSGIHGTVAEMDDLIVTVTVSESCKIRFDKAAIVTVIKKS